MIQTTNAGTTPDLIDMPSESTICLVCQEIIGSIRHDSSIEKQYALPCGHIFGSICILRWLEDSPQQDCPHCRRTMIHPGCKHLIMPHEATTAPATISERETPEQCVRCRGEGVVAQALKFEHERLLMQEKALRGMQIHLPRFGGLAAKTVVGVEERIGELRRVFALFHEKAWREFAEMDRRQKW